jgi:hypothetical protein
MWNKYSFHQKELMYGIETDFKIHLYIFYNTFKKQIEEYFYWN